MESDKARPASSFATGTGLFIKLLGVCHAAAFGSLWIQQAGLIGPGGILPAGQFLDLVREVLGRKGWLEVPTLCWLTGTHPAIAILCALGCVLSVLLVCGVAQAPCLALLWALYLSLASVGQTFFDFQWDALLLETTLIAIFMVPWRLRAPREPYDPPFMARALAAWLLFRLMFMSGLVKLTSGDPTWRNLTALRFHFETQPLPSPVAWYAHQLPGWFQSAACGVMFVIELLAPLCLAMPRRVRNPAVVSIILLQVAIALTGSYAFFNLLTIAICLASLDDDWWRSIRWGVQPAIPDSADSPAKRTLLRWFAAFSVGVTFFVNAAEISPRAANSPIVQFVGQSIGPFRSFNTYGLFAVMTVERPELIIQGSSDGRDWRDYALPYKPGDLARRPSWAAPHQPRLDWQLWFAAFTPPERATWVKTLCERLLRGDPDVLALFSRNPFPDAPPRYLRVARYQYEFTSFEGRARTGNWWRRTPIDFYVPPVSLTDSTP
jgi:uncharacterized membrane protein YphA (DoxX/SURF4 family)